MRGAVERHSGRTGKNMLENAKTKMCKKNWFASKWDAIAANGILFTLLPDVVAERPKTELIRYILAGKLP